MSRRSRQDVLPVLLTAAEVARWLGVTRKALYLMLERGQVPAHTVIRIGTRLRFDEARLRDWIADKRAPSRGAVS